MRYFLLALFFFSIPGAYAEPPTRYRYSCPGREHPLNWDTAACGKSELEAVRLVNEKYGERLVERLINNPKNKYPWYWVYLEENECNLSVTAKENAAVVTTMNQFDVDKCKGEAKAWRFSRFARETNGKLYIDDDDF